MSKFVFTPPAYWAGSEYYLLRDAKNHKVLNIAPTPHGLTWTTSMTGNLLYYTNGKIKITPTHVYIVSNNGKPLNKSDKVYVEHVTPSTQ